MGYNEANTKLIQETYRSLGLNKKDLIITEIGTQQIQYIGDELPVLSYYAQHRANLYKKYNCLDLHPAPNTTIVDLSEQLPIDVFTNCISDVVINLGTSEHIEPEQGHYQIWKTMHDITKIKGIQIHDLPKYGFWKNHCRFWYDENFVNELAKQNNYTIYTLNRWIDNTEGEGILVTLIKNEYREFMSFEEFKKIIKFDCTKQIPTGLNNPKNY